MKAFLISFLLASCLVTHASTSPETNTPEGPLTVYEQLREHVRFSSFSQKHQLEGTVYIRFYIDELHVVQMKSISGTNKKLAQYVRAKLRNKEVFGQLISIGKIYEMTFSYIAPSRIGGRMGARPLR